MGLRFGAAALIALSFEAQAAPITAFVVDRPIELLSSIDLEVRDAMLGLPCAALREELRFVDEFDLSGPLSIVLPVSIPDPEPQTQVRTATVVHSHVPNIPPDLTIAGGLLLAGFSIGRGSKRRRT